MNSKYDIIIIGGGAAGFFTAINCAKKNPTYKIAILERGKEVLSKVKISGGGRCNVTHACFVPNDLAKFYPRGEKELRGPFHQFCSGDTMDWFEQRGVSLKIEDDNRIFPVSDSSQTIIDCFLAEVQKYKIDILTGESVKSLYQTEEKYWKIDTNHSVFKCKKIVVTTGSNPKIWEMLSDLGHKIIPPVPSLFTFNIKDMRLQNLMGVSALASVKVLGTNLKASGAVLITHWGLSGPAVLKVSAWGARILNEKNYQFVLQVNWLNELNFEEVLEQLNDLKLENAKKQFDKFCPFDFPKRLWESLLNASNINPQIKWADLSKKQLISLTEQLTNSQFQVNGKSTFKDEFVTAGGVDLKEVNFKTMESKLLPNLFFAGEVLNIDAITGGFNFQNAWTTGFIASQNL